MRSSPDSERVMLPTFEEMMGILPISRQDGQESLLLEEPEMEEAEEEAEEQPPERSEAEEELERVEKLCEGMRLEAIAQSQEILRQAREEAVAIEHKALIHGRETAQKELEQEREKLRDAAVSAAKALEKAREELCGYLEPGFLDVAVAIAESILKLELDKNDNAYLSIVRNMVEQTYMARDVVLHLPTGRYKELTEKDHGAFLLEMEQHKVKVDSDPALAETDCLITSDMGSIQGGVKTQLARIKHTAMGQGIQ